MTDWFTDELFQHAHTNTKRLVFPYSRLFVDVERFRDDSKEEMYKQGQGVIYTRINDDNFRLPSKGSIDYIYNLYDIHHEKLQELSETSSIIVDCHSFYGYNKESNDVDFCIGTTEYTPIDLVEDIISYLGKTCCYLY